MGLRFAGLISLMMSVVTGIGSASAATPSETTATEQTAVPASVSPLNPDVNPVTGRSVVTPTESGLLKNEKFEDTRLLTDPKLRAEEGSMSKYSIKFNASYYGPTLADLSAKDQPNPDGSVGSYATSLGGSIAARYRVSSSRAVSFGTGIKAIYPLHGIERFDVNNPYLSYDMSSRWGRLQMRNSPSISLITVPNYKAVGEYGALAFYNSFVYEFDNDLSVGLDSDFGYYLYDRAYRSSDGKANQYSISFSPTLKYRINERLNINTSVSVMFWNPRSLDNDFALWNRSPTQRLGLAYAWTKEIYLNPYLYLYPNRITTDSTSMNFSAIFSVL